MRTERNAGDVISNRRYELDRSGITDAGELLELIEKSFTEPALRWFISAADKNTVTVESTEYSTVPAIRQAGNTPARSGLDAVISIVPTGVGCAIGGYAGDAAPATALLAEAADVVITNPNAVNASNFIRADRRILYTEGSCVDAFSSGEITLRRSRGNRVGLIVEAADPAAVEHILNVTNAVRAVHGVDVVDYVVTNRPIGTRCVQSESGAFVGTIDAPEVLLDAAAELAGRGATAIAITTNVQDLGSVEYAAHFSGACPNPVGGAEAVLSHLVVRAVGLPAAHAPMMNFKDLSLDHAVVDARSAGELVSISGLACVLIGLAGAPQFSGASPGWRVTDHVTRDDVVAVVAPSGALGGIPVLAALNRGTPVIAVRDNSTILDVTAEKLGLPGVLDAASYAEAAGLILALRAGLSIETIRRPMRTLGRLAGQMEWVP